MAQSDEPSYDRMDFLPGQMGRTKHGAICHDVAVILLGIVAVIALVFSAIALSRPGATTVQLDGSRGSTCTGADEDKVWLFAIGHDGKSNLEYIDKLSGTLRGFHVDMVEAVCNVANKNCRLMWDVYENCYTSKAGERPRPGVGLLSQWYDACTGWFATFERASSVSFTKPFRKPQQSRFYVKRGNPAGFGSNNIAGKKIGFLDGAASSEFCLLRTGIQEEDLPTDNIIHFTTRESIIKAVNAGTVDAVFGDTHFFRLGLDLDPVGEPVTSCMQDGAGMMFRKDSRLPDWWNPAFEQLKQSSDYERICSEVTETHDNSDEGVDCVD